MAIALTGLLFGVLLAMIAPEELVSGRKYFILLQRLLAGIIIVFVAYSFIQEEMFLVLSLWCVAAVILVIVDDTVPKLGIKIVAYGILALPYFAFSTNAFQLLLASLLFLYGLPVGTLLVREYSKTLSKTLYAKTENSSEKNQEINLNRNHDKK